MLKETVTITLSLLVAFVASIPIADRAEKRTPTLLVSLDGLQATKLDEFLRNNPDSYMNRFFVDRGVKADYMAASFPTLTFPNHFTLVTGLYQESHGIVGNTLFDPKIDKRVNFLSDSYANDEMWWDQAEPIWLSAKRQGLKTASFFWTGSEVWRRHPDVFLSYSSTLNFLDRCEEVVSWFQKFEMDFVTLYFNQPDSTGHDYGPNSKEYMQKIGEVDEVIGYLLTLLICADLLDKVNVLIVSDHGMAEMTSTIVISNLLSTSLLNTTKSVYGIVGSIWPRTDAQKQEVFDALSKSPLLKVYFKEDMPPEYNFKNNDRIGPIVTIADEGYILSTGTNVLKGNHGFDNRYESMRAVFMAHGPDFKRNVRIGPVANVDVYPLLCELVNVRCNPNNGTIIAFSQGLAFTPKNLSYN